VPLFVPRERPRGHAERAIDRLVDGLEQPADPTSGHHQRLEHAHRRAQQDEPTQDCPQDPCGFHASGYARNSSSAYGSSESTQTSVILPPPMWAITAARVSSLFPPRVARWIPNTTPCSSV